MASKRIISDTQSISPPFAGTPRKSEIQALVRDHFEEYFLPSTAALDSNLDMYQQYKAAFWELERAKNWTLMRSHTCNEQHQDEETQRIVHVDVVSFYTTGVKRSGRKKSCTLQELDLEISDDYAGPAEAELAFNEDDVDHSYFVDEEIMEDTESNAVNGVFMGLGLQSLGHSEAGNTPRLLVDLSPTLARRLAEELLQIAAWYERADSAIPYCLKHPFDIRFMGPGDDQPKTDRNQNLQASDAEGSAQLNQKRTDNYDAK